MERRDRNGEKRERWREEIGMERRESDGEKC